MKKLLTFLIAVIYLISGIPSFALDQNSELLALGIDGAILANAEDDELISRAEFVHMSARLLDGEEKDAFYDVFSDVSSGDKYAGDIQFLKNMGIIVGVDNNMFLPDNNITTEAAYKIILNVMGYESLADSLGGFPEGYISLASSTKLSLNTQTKDGYVTKAGAKAMIYYALTAKLYNFTYVMNDGKMSVVATGESGGTLLAKRGISVYNGVVEEVNAASRSITFTVSKNKYDSNPYMAASGERLLLTLPDGYDVYEFEKVSVVLWMTENEEVIYIQPQKGTSILYGFIDSVNGDTSKKGYGIKYIDEITLLNIEEEFDVSDNAVLRFNGAETQTAVTLLENFAKLVIEDDEITFIESWEAEAGGIITHVTDDEISYIKEDSGAVKLKGLDSYNVKRVFINGKVSSKENLKPDTVFDYAVIDDMIMINANETVVTDVLNTVSFAGGEVKIGGITYKIKNLYHSTDGKSYKGDNDLSSLFSVSVKAYFDPSGYVRYITPESAEALAGNKFFGVVLGTETDVFDENKEVDLYRIYPDEIKKETYKLTEKATFTGTAWDDVRRSAKNLDGEGVFEFTVNASGLITDVSAPRLFEGFGTGTKNYITGSFTSVGTPYVTIGGKALYFPETKMVCLYELDGEYLVGTIDWMTSLYGQSLAQSLTLSFYRDDSDGTYPALVVITGGVDAIGYRESKRGMYAGYSYGIDENGEKCINAHIYTGQKEYSTFRVTEEFVKNNLGDMKYGLITYKDAYKFAENEISISEKVDLSGESIDWAVIETENTAGMHKGTIKRIDNNRLWLANGETYFMNVLSSARLFFELNENMPSDKALKAIDYTDLSPGDEIFYYIGSSITVGAIIKVV